MVLDLLLGICHIIIDMMENVCTMFVKNLWSVHDSIQQKRYEIWRKIESALSIYQFIRPW